MSTYLFSIQTAAIVFVALAAFLTFPYTIYAYRKFGAISIFRTILIFSFIFYVECAWFMTVLPLPNPEEVAQMTGPTTQLVPFAFLLDFIRNAGFVVSSPSTWLPAIKSSYFYVPAFNVCLTLPFGIYLGYYFKSSLRKVVLLTFLLSLFFEITQLTGLYGIYPRAYRLFDVDDLILNTAGGLIGYGIYAIFKNLLPSRDKLDKADAIRSERVSYLRRLVAFAVDAIGLSILSPIIARFLPLDIATIYTLLMIVYCSICALLFKGATIGKMMVRMQIQGENKMRVFLRYLLRNSIAIVMQFLPEFSENESWQMLAVFVQLIALVFILVDLWRSIKHKDILWYERLTKTRVSSTFKLKVRQN